MCFPHHRKGHLMPFTFTWYYLKFSNFVVDKLFIRFAYANNNDHFKNIQIVIFIVG
jgi:hypothetical protein